MDNYHKPQTTEVGNRLVLWNVRFLADEVYVSGTSSSVMTTSLCARSVYKDTTDWCASNYRLGKSSRSRNAWQHYKATVPEGTWYLSLLHLELLQGRQLTLRMRPVCARPPCHVSRSKVDFTTKEQPSPRRASWQQIIARLNKAHTQLHNSSLQNLRSVNNPAVVAKMSVARLFKACITHQ